jgi:hypothetical protein
MAKSCKLVVVVNEEANDGMEEFIKAKHVFVKKEEKTVKLTADTVSELVKKKEDQTLYLRGPVRDLYPLPENANLFILIKI